jgi:hypothetical protein
MYTMGVSDDAKSFATSLTMPFCGPNLGFEPTSWLSKPSEVQSLALLTLREGPTTVRPRPSACWCWARPTAAFRCHHGYRVSGAHCRAASAALGRLRITPGN